MGLPRISYNPGGGAVTIDFVRGPRGFEPYYETRANDNLSTSGVRERVVEAHDILIALTMPGMELATATDMPAWGTFIKWALGGGQFDFYPNFAAFATEYYHCVLEDRGYRPRRVALKRYAASFMFRVVPDAQQPSSPDQVLKRFHGIAG